LLPPVRRNFCEIGGRLAPLSKLFWEVRGSDDKPLLHIWSEQYNLTRRVIAITDHSDARWFWPWNALGALVPIAWSLYASSSSGLRGNCHAKDFANV
jgi:hypothetical protein